MPINIITEHGFDRLKLWFDRSEIPIPIETLRPYCRDAIFTLGEMHFGANWKSSLEIFQPTTECLRMVRTALGNDVRAVPEYIEIALDLIPTSNRPRLAKQLERAFLAAAVPKYHRREAVCVSGTWYFERRTERGMRRRPNVMAVYSDKPSKINNKSIDGAVPCLHIEWRVSGSPAMRRIGLRTLDDLITFKPEQFWPRHVELYALPGSTQLGRVLSRLNGGKKDASEQAHRKRASNWIGENSLKSIQNEEAFVLYNALRETDRRAFKLYKITFKRWLHILKNSQNLALANASKRHH